MGLSPISSKPILFLLHFLLNLTHLSTSATDYTSLVYKGCSREPLSDPTGQYSQSLSTLFSTLLQQSSKSRFSKSTSGGIAGLYQCRGDLSNADCYNCVAKIPPQTQQLCNGLVKAARIQLLGCYLLYEVSGFTQISGYELLYKQCSRNSVPGYGFEIKRDEALNAMVNGIGANGGFYAAGFEGVYVVGQCEGDLSGGDCGQCVKTAVQRGQTECGGALGGQVFLHKCFISYTYYPNGVPKGGGADGAFSGDGSSSSSSSSGQDTGRTVAIIVGGIAAVGFLVICVLFVKGWRKKDDDD